MENEGATNASSTTSHPQKVHLVKPPKKLNEMTQQERRVWAKASGGAVYYRGIDSFFQTSILCLDE